VIGAILGAAKGANPAGALFSLLWKPVGILLIVLGLWWWAHHAGVVSGREEGAKALATVTDQRARALADLETAKGANATLVATNADLKAANGLWASEADRLADEGLAAVQREERRAAKAEAEAAKWSTKYANETGKPKCAAALAALPLACPNLEHY
jgi:hypothetical protein